VQIGPVRQILLALAIVGVFTGVAWIFDVDLTAAALILLAAVIVASFVGFAASITAAAAAFLSLNILFTPPTGSLAIHRSDDVLALVVFSVTAVLLGWSVQRLNALAIGARRAERETRLRLRLTNSLLEGASLDEALPSTLDALREVFNFEGCTLQLPDRTVTSGAFDATPNVRVEVANVRLDAHGEHDLVTNDLALLEALVAGIATAADRLRLEDEVRDARVVAEIGRQRAGFLSAVSHNLRTPLTAVKAAASTLLSSWSRLEPEDRRELIETIADEAERLERLVRNTLELSRIRAGALDADLEPVDIADLVQHAVRRLRPIIRAHRVRLDVGVDLPEVWLDVTMVDQILLNLLENALRFAPPGSEILVCVRPAENDHVELRISDHGTGVPPEARDRIFEEFQSVDTRPDRSGTGLGLAIVRALVTAQGGTVRYEDTPGGGATFVCTFPREAR
jgi:two-component system sensor histidine kinase KdpD